MVKPRLNIDIDGPDGNVFMILGRAKTIAKKNGLDWDSIKKEATSGDYDTALDTMRKYFDCNF